VTDNFLFIAEVGERPSMQMFDIEIFNLNKLNIMPLKEHYQVKISSRFASLENLDDDGDFSRALEGIGDIIKIPA
jgi:hypothetical protein